MNDNNDAKSPNTDAGEKLPYHKPELKEYGTLRTVTLARTAAEQFESGLGVGYGETIPIDAAETGWSRRDVQPSGGRGSRER